MAEGERQVIEVDIATRLFGDKEDIYVVRPGISFSLYNDFRRENAVFLDFPDLPFALDNRPSSSVTVREIVARSIALRDWHRRKLSDEPSRDQKDYKGQATGKRVGAYIGAIQRLYYELPVGTIIIIPSKTYVGDVLFAELSGPTERREAARAYTGEQMLVRPVRWLGEKQKASLSADLRASLGQPTPVMQLPRSQRGEVLRAAFKQYVFEGVHSTRLTTTQEDFSILDDLNIQLFTNYFAGLLAATEGNPKDAGSVDLDKALAILRQHRDLIPELDQSISSPGFQRMYSGHIAPLVIGAVMTAALSGVAFAQTPDIRIKNSAMLAKDPCAVQVQAAVSDSIRLAYFDEFKRRCEALQQTRRATGLTTSMSATERKPRKK